MLRIYDECLELVRECRVTAEAMDCDQRRQLRRAALSVPLNVAEGSGQRLGNRRLRYETALGSAREVLANLECGEAIGDVAFPEETRRRLNRIIGTLVRVLY